MPLGFGMALGADPAAMAAFGELTPNERRDFVERARSARSKRDMESLVNEIRLRK